ncbi:hypothetical protein chiPu_0007916 [Chiloscyllium punctatum]|uniref:Uncharacterized protein n=1 Tax=Chiloscyllium punctatum TaxID=137246 RepID=A0A401SGG8_CHIPU|nr:hypothetical protein [Chiloscyllium punctatum]
MRKSGPGETISKLLRRKSSPSLYAVTPPPGRAIAGAGEPEAPDNLDEILAATAYNKGAISSVMDSGTAKVKQRPTVKLAIVMLDFSLFLIIVQCQGKTLLSKKSICTSLTP